MAYKYRNPQSPPSESAFPSYASNPLSPQRHPHRLSGSTMQQSTNNADIRSGLTRRFTTNALPSLSPIGQQRRQAAGDNPVTTVPYSRIAPSERRIRHIEGLLEQQRRIKAELDNVDDDTRREIEEGLRHERAVTQMIAQSEPTTPPEYQDAFPSAVTRPNRYSTASLTSPPGIATRPNRSSTQLTSPGGGFARPYTATTTSRHYPSQSVPGSRRQSDDEEEDDFLFGYDTALHRAAANPNRNSMPVTSHDRNHNAADHSSALGPLNTTSFLFEEDDKPSTMQNTRSSTQTSPDTKTYLQMQHTADGFPKLIRRPDNGEVVSGSSAALDLALSQFSDPEQQAPERASANRHRISLPPSALSSNGNIAPLNSILANANEPKPSANNRRSMEVKFSAETKRPALMASPPSRGSSGTPKPQSYSTNDLPTLKSINGDNNSSNGGVPLNSPPTQSNQPAETAASPEKATHSRNTSIHHKSRQSQDFSAGKFQENNENFLNPQSGLQANAAPFGPMQEGNNLPPFATPAMPYGQPSFYPGGYGMNMLNNGFGNMNLGGGFPQGQWPNQMPPFPQQLGFNGYQQVPQQQPNQVAAGASRYTDGQRSGPQPRKSQPDDMFANMTVPDLIGQIYGLCKDQHGCRFLQRKLEEREERDVQIIFDEVKGPFAELMTDPFGNYLCQRLLEHSTDEQRTVLVRNAVPAMTRIALNQHGTRALQRMIEFISTHEQIEMVIEALRNDVVALIQDLNGNHVIQKCLNHLTAPDAQFIFDAVAANCVVVGTHRHGCCVLQRCVDHATGDQKGAMVHQIIANAFNLVQDPFGNYVVQYILDLAEPSFTEPLCHNFLGNVSYLSKQKFSSNVIEKCIRSAGPDTKRMLVNEIMPPHEIEKLLRDSFANYVVQTAIDFADEETKAVLIENIRPMLPSVRHTPYGRRIQSKISEYDGASNPGLAGPGYMSPGTMTPAEPHTSPAPYVAPAPQAFGRGNRTGMVGPPAHWNSNANGAYNPGFAPNGGDISSPVPQRHQAFNMLNGAQNYQHGFGGPAFQQNMGRQQAPQAFNQF